MNPYKVLGIEQSADARDVKKAYFDLAKRHHPDKGGNEDEFKKIQKAYDVLSDPEKRSFYDQTGQFPDEQGGGGSGEMPGGMGFPFDLGGIFGMFGGPFGGAFPMPGRSQPSGPPSSRRRGKGPPKVHEIPLNLQDFYHGRNIKINFERQKFCSNCKGDGYLNFTNCDECRGTGTVSRMMTMGPGMQMISQSPCGVCGGKGQKPGPKCFTCSGKCYQDEQKSLNVLVEPGMKVGERLIFPNECSDSQEHVEAGDVHIVLMEADEESGWKREGNTLRYSHSVGLCESLLGSNQTLKGHPGFSSGFEFSIPVGSQHLTEVVVKGAGMPIRGTDQKGDAIITLQVRVSESEKKALEQNVNLLRSALTL